MKTKKEKIKSFNIDYRHWGKKFLLTNGGAMSSTYKMCCLGFLGKACGYDDVELMGRCTPSSLSDMDKILYPKFLIKKNEENYWTNANVASALMAINDDENLSNELKINVIGRIFAKHGIKVTWSNIPSHVNYAKYKDKRTLKRALAKYYTPKDPGSVQKILKSIDLL